MRNAAYWEAKFRLNVERDRRHDQALGAAGWTVLRIWEHEAPADAADRIERLLERFSNAAHDSAGP
jgi:DNA mismatch endonuclease (patch repair protein)